MIIVVNCEDNLYSREPFKVYIGRPSVLGNPYDVSKYGRDGCIKMYRAWLDAAMKSLVHDKTEFIRTEIYRLVALHRKYGRLALECWCKPLACHGDYIKAYLEEHFPCKGFEHEDFELESRRQEAENRRFLGSD